MTCKPQRIRDEGQSSLLNTNVTSASTEFMWSNAYDPKPTKYVRQINQKR